MKKVLQYLLFFAFLFFSAHVAAQKKYALLVGINRYYDKPGVLHGSVLRGCVNDANGISDMLINRFGFEKNDITILTDEMAGRKNVDGAFNTILQKVKAGDAFVFYFSGHGVWMDNLSQNLVEQKLKKGMNQAFVLSDLYADNLGCLYRDASLKQVFNKFVDKKVIATGIFDCCYSGQLAQGFIISLHNPYEVLTPTFANKSMTFYEIFTGFAQNNDSLQRVQNPDWDVFASNILADSSNDTKGFNLKDNLQINDSVFVTRPSERPRSMFLSLSGTDQYQKGEEMKDATGAYHGVFTKALLQTIDENPGDIPVQTLFDKISIVIKNNGFHQTPVRFQDPQRLSLNLAGIKPVKPANNYTRKFTKTNPLLKLYLHLQPVAAAVYKQQMDQKIIPLAQSVQYRNYLNWNATERSRYIFLDKTGFVNKDLSRYLKAAGRDSTFFVFLPLPENVLSAFKQKLQQDQNYMLVDDPSKAQLVLYLNYTKEEGDGYVFTWAPPLLKQNGCPVFYTHHVKTAQLPTDKKGTAVFANELYEMTNNLAREFTGVWLNNQVKRGAGR